MLQGSRLTSSTICVFLIVHAHLFPEFELPQTDGADGVAGSARAQSEGVYKVLKGTCFYFPIQLSTISVLQKVTRKRIMALARLFHKNEANPSNGCRRENSSN